LIVSNASPTSYGYGGKVPTDACASQMGNALKACDIGKVALQRGKYRVLDELNPPIRFTCLCALARIKDVTSIATLKKKSCATHKFYAYYSFAANLSTLA
jgi:hypothetical protein